jgi:hypothetical protein
MRKSGRRWSLIFVAAGTHMRILRAIRCASNAMRSVDAEKTKEARR